MAFYVVAYPEVAAADLQWIEDYRMVHDAYASNLIRAHFTLVFNISELDREAIVSEVEMQCRGQRRIEFELAVATINRDYFADRFHEFLVPEKGYSALVRLHDRLYSGALQTSLNLNIDFIPHITIGSSLLASESKSRVDRLNHGGVSIPGVVRCLDIIQSGEDKISTVKQVKLE
jgi:2'-5' RNA ligase